ncbi:hypothetical protein K5X82_03520 [Halosquirtibacter xylanolyticus]|uniref:OmpL47-type beta-barrel domain-containing protein n=1 Tax=Halosquirtibacter xylanolyticus TaxID=3374599 RepID=UPI00374881F4|nr:hypothetical protein K5X82_03520 [Prolixibacteraceae bacterium]
MNLRLYFILLLMGFQTVKAQEKVTVKRHYYTDDHGQLYVPKSFPMFLYITSDTIAKKDMQRLNSQEMPQYTNPFYFDTEGRNTIRSPWAVDKETKQTVEPKIDVVFDVYVDGSTPFTRHHYSNAPSYFHSHTQFFGKGITVSLKSTDKYSGVEKTYFSINKAPFTTYNKVLSEWKEGENNIQFYAIDHVGFVEKTHQKNFVYDITAPTTTHTINGPKIEAIVSPKAIINLSSIDTLSGVHRTYYAIDKGKMKQYITGYTFGKLDDGYHTVRWKSEDHVQNMEQEKSFKVYVDKTAPETKYNIIGDLYKKGKIKYISTRSKISLEATDNKAGVKEIFFNPDQTAQNTFSEPFNIEGKFGKHNIAYWAKDKVENNEKIHSFGVFLDNKNPVTRIVFSQPQFFTRDTLFVGPKTKFTLLASDRGAGVSESMYSINDGETKKYKKSQKLETEGFYTVKFHSIDKVNNKEVEKTSELFVDASAPEIYVNFSIKKIDDTEKDGKKVPVYPNYSRMYIGATDKYCGTDRIEYAINKGAFIDYSSPKTLDISELDLFQESKFYVVKIRAYDKLGNMSEKKIEFYVKNE